MNVRRLLTGFGALAASAFAVQAIGFVALAVAARELGPAKLGAANLALALGLYFAIPANFGLTLLGIRDVARDPARAREIVGEIFVLRLALSVATFAALVALAPVVAPAEDVRPLLPIAALTILVGVGSGEWVLLAAQRSVLVALGRLAGQAVYAVLVVAFITAGQEGAERFVWFSVASVAITAVFTQLAAWRVLGRPRPSLDRRRLVRRWRSSLPLGVAVVMVQVYLTAGALLLGYLRDTADVGQWGVAEKIPLALIGVVQLWSATLYPQAAQLIGPEPERLRSQVSLFTSLGVMAGLPLVAGAVITGATLIPALFGGAYGPAGEVFAVITLALALSLVTVSPSSVLAAGGHERTYAAGRVLAALTTIFSGLVAVSLIGLLGAAIALVVGELAALVYMVDRYRRLVGPLAPQWGRMLRAALATGLMSAALLAAEPVVGVGWLVALGLAVYPLAVLACGAVRLSEVRSFAAARR